MAPTAPAGWFLEADGTRYRYWDGTNWTQHTSPAVAPPVAPATAGPIRWFEPLVYIGLLILWFGLFVVVGLIVGHVSMSGKVAYTQAQHDRYVEQAVTMARVAGVLVALIGMAIIAPRVGYRSRDTFIQLIPLVGWVVVFKLLWRLACIRRHYWSPAP